MIDQAGQPICGAEGCWPSQVDPCTRALSARKPAAALTPRSCDAAASCRVVRVGWLSHEKQFSHNTGAVRARHSAFVNRRLVTTVCGVSIVAEQGRVRKVLMSRVKHPMLRLSQNVTN